MAEPQTRLILITAPGAGPDLAARLASAMAAGDVAAVIARLAPDDERGLVNTVKQLAPVVQEAGAALVIACAGQEVDLVTVAARGGADGIHVESGPEAGESLRALRERLRDGRILGVGSLDSKHAAMAAGEAGADYVLLGDDPEVSPESVLARAAWWAEIFETPCIALARSVEAVPDLAATGAEFIGLPDAVWDGPGGEAAVAAAQRHLGAGTAR
ncbi:Thiamine-phosphate synthase [Methylobacterium crusticola]|uniref:Thiamine-phosphate synthase n=1 Tax=Methylobacterium crusticola TaxID=1697972 RepID=A0ABQ4R1J8_9HYPH|nr:thiamine phosphate synthase [Methylobacterium crusticola]GJD50721.1 Thiamine-phosphate synthase [Methylobacterium crusticola]